MMQNWQQEGKHLLVAGLCQEVSGAFGWVRAKMDPERHFLEMRWIQFHLIRPESHQVCWPFFAQTFHIHELTNHYEGTLFCNCLSIPGPPQGKGHPGPYMKGKGTWGKWSWRIRSQKRRMPTQNSRGRRRDGNWMEVKWWWSDVVF